MDSLKMVSKYVVLSEGTLEWEIQDVSLHFEECDCCKERSGHMLRMNSGPMKMTAGGGKQSKWYFGLYSNYNATPRVINIRLDFYSLFGSDGSQIKESVNYKYTAIIKITTLERDEILQSFEGRESTEKRNESIYFKPIEIEKLKRDWPHGNLKISVQISHLSKKINEVFNNGQFLDLINLKDALPVPVSSCYGNLLNNPDLSDFKINCQGSTFQAHKFILSVRSRVFRVMIESGFSESTRNELKIQDVTAKTVKLMLEFIYKGTVAIFPEDFKEKIELLDCAEKYELDGLKSLCMRKIFSGLPTEKEVGELAMAAFTYGANERASRAIKNFCTMNHAKLIQNPEYKKAFLANPRAFMN